MARKKLFHHRAEFHDYCKPCMYHITLVKEDHTPNLCRIFQDPYIDANIKIAPRTKYTESGKIFHRELRNWKALNPKIRVMTTAIMPDHVHIMLRVMERLDKKLGAYISYLTGACSRAINDFRKEDNPQAFKSFFTEDFTDVLIDERDQRDICFRYIMDNPKRYLARKLLPEFFSSKMILTTRSGQYELYGNLFLLAHPVKTVVRWSSHFSEEEWERLCKKYAETIRGEGVLISPFIHPNERDFRDMGMDANAKLIVISTNGLPDIFKPSGRYFSLCEEGRLLIVAKMKYEYNAELHRGGAMDGNALAEELAQIRREEYRLSRKPRSTQG